MALTTTYVAVDNYLVSARELEADLNLKINIASLYMYSSLLDLTTIIYFSCTCSPFLTENHDYV